MISKMICRSVLLAAAASSLLSLAIRPAHAFEVEHDEGLPDNMTRILKSPGTFNVEHDEGFSNSMTRLLKSAADVNNDLAKSQDSIREQNKRMEELEKQNKSRIKEIVSNCTKGLSWTIEFPGIDVENWASKEVKLSNPPVGEATLETQYYEGHIPFIDGYLIHHYHWAKVKDQEYLKKLLDRLEAGLHATSSHECVYQAPK